MPGVEIGTICHSSVGKRGHDVPCLLLGVGNRERDQACFVLGVELDISSGHYQARRTLAFDQPWLHTFAGLLYGLVADTALGEERTHEVGLKVAVHPTGLVYDQEPVR